jgi:lysophospholipase L1-like esterase
VAVLAAPSLLFLGLLDTAEGVARWWWPEIRPLAFLVRDPHDSHNFADARSTSIFEGDALRMWRLQQGLDEVIWDFTVVSTNAQGLRYPGEIAPRHTAPRVVCLGDSVSFGYRVPLVFPERPEEWRRHERPYPALAEAALREEIEGAEVVPLAVPGYSSHQGRLWLESEIASLSPDVVTACFGWNDASLRAVDDATAMVASRAPLRRRLTSSQLLMRLSLALAPEAERPAVADWRPRVDRDAFLENHRAIAASARAHGARFVALAPVLRDPEAFPDAARRIADYRDALRALALAEGWGWVELAELSESAWPGNDRLFGETIHPNAEGHRRLAAALVPVLKRELGRSE